MTDDAAAAAKSEQPDPRFEKFGVPTALYLGKEPGQWVLTCFADESHAVDWLKNGAGKRQMFLVTLCDITQLDLVAPKPYLEVRQP